MDASGSFNGIVGLTPLENGGSSAGRFGWEKAMKMKETQDPRGGGCPLTGWNTDEYQHGRTGKSRFGWNKTADTCAGSLNRRIRHPGGG